MRDGADSQARGSVAWGKIAALLAIGGLGGWVAHAATDKLPVTMLICAANGADCTATARFADFQHCEEAKTQSDMHCDRSASEVHCKALVRPSSYAVARCQ